MNKIIICLLAGVLTISMFCLPVAAAEQDTLKLNFDLKTYVKEEAVDTAVYTEKYGSTTAPTTYIVNNTDKYIEFGANSDIIANQKAVAVEAYFEAVDINNRITSNTIHFSATEDYYVNNISYIYNKDIFNDFDGDGMYEVRIPISATGEPNKFNLMPFDLTSLGYIGYLNQYGFSRIVVNIYYEIPTYNPNTEDCVTLYTLNNGYTYTKNGSTVTVGGVRNAKTPFFANPYYAMFSTIKTNGAIEQAFPLKSGLFEPAKIIPALESRKCNGTKYVSPTAVINDVLANYTDVKFTFKTYDGYVDTATGKGYATKQKNTDWHNPIFGQHLYDGLKPEDYNWSNDVTSFNLITGGLVVNSGLTMQLSDVDRFTWGEDSLSFYWEDITEGANVNKATEFITSMLLYTPADWYWNTLTIEAWNSEIEDASCGAGVEADDEELIDDEEEEAITEDTEVDVEVTDDYVEENPKTGNPDVLMLIIPAIMSGTAIVSKKFKK